MILCDVLFCRNEAVRTLTSAACSVCTSGEEAPMPPGWYLWWADYRRCVQCGAYEARTIDTPWQRILYRSDEP